MSLHEFFEWFIIVGLATFGCIYLPAQFYSYLRRRKRNKICLQCRLCGFRFLKADPHAICPHCEAKNK